MAKAKSSFICQACGTVHPRWMGKCEACGAWNTIQEEITEAAPPKGLGNSKSKRVLDLVGLEFTEQKKLPRHKTGISEFDRVVGGGLVSGCALLLGGDPGIGKSTLLLQIVCALAQKNLKCLYISGEEAVDQVRLRAERMQLDKAPVQLATATNVRDIVATLDSENVDIAIIDSIQTMYVDTIDSAPGTVTQVRTAAQELIRVAKKKNIAIFLVGHVTKDGQIAGPRVLEHMVDTVLYFEGDRGHQFRILRTVKNRFGPTDEIGVFEMGSLGLSEVTNPSALFLTDREHNVTGSSVFAGLEGTRPILVEVQALIAAAPYGAPRRAVVGWDHNRLAMVVAVLESRGGLQFSGSDIYLNMAGGLKVTEPAADLAVAASLISSLLNVPVPRGTVFFGEIGLSGEVRPVSQPDLRLKEAQKLGFTGAVLAKNINGKSSKLLMPETNFTTTPIGHIDDLVQFLKSS